MSNINQIEVESTTYDIEDTTARNDIGTINGKIPSSASSSNKLATASDIPSVTGKADKVNGATNGNFASLDSNGNLADSGHKHSDYLTSIPTASTSTKGGVKVDGTTITINNEVISAHSSGGSTVVPNPTGTATTDLTKIGIDGTNYNIPTSDTSACYKTSDSAETTLADDDKFPFYDTSASGKRSSTWSNIKAKLKSYFDTLYTGNTGTVTSVATGAGLTGGTITGSGTIKAKLKSETQSSLTAADKGSTANREYAVGVDASGNLSVNVPWTGGGTIEDITSTITFGRAFTDHNYSRFYRYGKVVFFHIEGSVDVSSIGSTEIVSSGISTNSNQNFTGLISGDNNQEEFHGCSISYGTSKLYLVGTTSLTNPWLYVSGFYIEP